MQDDGVILVLAALLVVLVVVVLLSLALVSFWQQDLRTIRTGLAFAFAAAVACVGYGLWRAAGTGR